MMKADKDDGTDSLMTDPEFNENEMPVKTESKNNFNYSSPVESPQSTRPQEPQVSKDKSKSKKKNKKETEEEAS